MKILDFFLFLWVIFALLDPDNSCGSGSETLGAGTKNIHFKRPLKDVYHSEKIESLMSFTYS
jgi:hypothetical protein